MRTHSCARRAPIGCMARKPGSTRSTPSSVASTSAMRGSVSYVAVSGGGHGLVDLPRARRRASPGSCASRSNRIVVPVRPCPTMTIGGTTSRVPISGCAVPVRGDLQPVAEIARELAADDGVAELVERRFARAASRRGVRVRPRQVSAPKSESPVASHACSTSRVGVEIAHARLPASRSRRSPWSSAIVVVVVRSLVARCGRTRSRRRCRATHARGPRPRTGTGAPRPRRGRGRASTRRADLLQLGRRSTT